MKRFANHWGTEFLLKECFGNLYFYQNQQAKQRKLSSRGTTKHAPRQVNSHSDRQDGNNKRDTDPQQDRARKAAAHKAAAYRAADRKAAKRKADTQDDEESDSHHDEDGMPYNDGETELEELPDERRKAIERDEIGIPSKLSQFTLKAL
jgi:hypothetical protein